MFNIQNYSSFIMAIIIFQLVPGAGTITILNATARNGVGSGMRTVLGTITGDFIYMLAAVLGLAAVLSAYPGILASAQWIGVIYLCWMGWKLLRTSVSNQPSDIALEKGSWGYFRQALAVSLTNPKVIMFFMAFFPLFLSSDSEPATLFIMMVHVTILSILYQTGLVFIGKTAAQTLSRWKWARLLATRLAGIALIGFGGKLALNIR
ncbi:MAG: LysE family translocator [Deltaproteobacteria bacterium]|nr:LysE family translocator [Deltaproteobacteria bacterium]